MNPQEIENFITESNRIEGILREPLKSEINEFQRFLLLPVVTVAELEKFVSVYQPGALLRDKPGRNVKVGRYSPPKGGKYIRDALTDVLACVDIYQQHIEYEMLHPFMDGNGRSGRALWAWRMKQFPLGFLHSFYYQTLAAQGTK